MRQVKSHQSSLLLSIGVYCLLAGCASSGNQKVGELKSEELQSMVKEKLKSKTEVSQAFGEPDGIDFDSNGNEKWIYKHISSSVKAQNFIPIVSMFSSGTDDVKKMVVFVFDKQGQVLQSAATQSKGETNTGILG